MSEIDDGGPAFPCESLRFEGSNPGMMLRDYFAGQALNGAMASGSLIYGKSDVGSATYSELAYRYADAMLAERKKARE